MNINSRVVLAMVAVVGVICTSIPLSENSSGEQAPLCSLKCEQTELPPGLHFVKHIDEDIIDDVDIPEDARKLLPKVRRVLVVLVVGLSSVF